MNSDEIMKSIADLNITIIKTITNRNKELGIDITPLQGAIIRILMDNDNMCQKELEQHVSCNKSTLSSVLDTMEKNDLIKREEYLNDSRKKIIFLTDKSKSIHCILDRDRKYLEDKIFNDISLDELKSFHNVISKMINNLERD